MQNISCFKTDIVFFWVVWSLKEILIAVDFLIHATRQRKSNIFHPHCPCSHVCVCVCSAYGMFVFCHCVRVEVGVVKVLFDSLICCVLPSSLLLCLDSSAASELLFRFGAHGSTRQPESKVVVFFGGEDKRSSQKERTSRLLVGGLAVTPCPVFV